MGLIHDFFQLFAIRLSWTFVPAYWVIFCILSVVFMYWFAREFVLSRTKPYHARRLLAVAAAVWIAFFIVFVAWRIWMTPPTVLRFDLVSNIQKRQSIVTIQKKDQLQYLDRVNQCPPLSPDRHLVMGLAQNMPVSAVRRFAGSLRRTGSLADIVLFYEDGIHGITPELLAVAKEFNILIYVYQTSYHPLYAYSSTRFVLYEEFLNGQIYPCRSYKDYDAVFVGDTRDLFFQRDPFTILSRYRVPEDGIAITLESGFVGEPSPQSGHLGINGQWITQCFGAMTMFEDNLAEQHIICSGTTIGTSKGMLKYFHAMVVAAGSSPFCYAHGSDQGVHQALVYLESYRRRYMPPIVNLGFEASPIITFNALPSKSVRFNSVGNVLKLDSNEIATIVHQYDRCKNDMPATDASSFKYGCKWLKSIHQNPDHILDKKDFWPSL